MSADAGRPAVRRVLVEAGEGVRRATLDVVTGADDAALVSVAAGGARVRVVCSCGGAPTCAHARFALDWLDADAARGPLDAANRPPVAGTGAVETGGIRGPETQRPPGKETLRPPAGHARATGLATALDDLVTTVVRAGVDAAAGTPSLDEAIRRVVAAAPAPLPASVGRVTGRLVEALVARDAGCVARLCHGLAGFADALRRGDAAAAYAWLGAAGAAALDPALRSAPDAEPHVPGSARLVDVRLVEVAREWVSTLDRAGLERRYLAAPSTGMVYREERVRGQAAPSLGPCPRVLDVALAEVEPGPAPQRVHLLQYEVALTGAPETFTHVVEEGLRGFAGLRSAFRAAVAASPALAEPFVGVQPRTVERADGRVFLVDGDGVRLPLAAEPPAAADALLALDAGAPPRLVYGRLLTERGSLALAPLSAIVGPREHMRLRRLA